MTRRTGHLSSVTLPFSVMIIISESLTMQWIIEHSSLLIGMLAAAGLSGVTIAGWVKQKMRLQVELLQQQLTSETHWHAQQTAQLQHSLQQAQQELDELDQQRDKAEFELKQAHGKVMAVMEKLRYFEAIKQERQQYAEQLNQMRDLKTQLEVQLHEQQARHEQQLAASQDKLQLLERAEERLKQQFEQLANQVFEHKTAKVDVQNKQSLEGLLSPLKEQLEGFKKQVNDSFNQEAKERHTLVHELRNLQQLNEH